MSPLQHHEPRPVSRTEPSKPRTTSPTMAEAPIQQPPQAAPAPIQHDDASGHSELGRLALDGPALTALQRTHGNAYVQRLITGRRPALIQRAPQTATSPLAELTLGTITLFPEQPVATLYKLVGRRNLSFNPLRINSDAKALLTKVPGLHGLIRAWRQNLLILDSHDGSGPDRLKAVQDAATKIGQQTRGRRGDRDRAVIEQYLESITAANTVLNELAEKQKAVEIAVGQVQLIALEKEKETAEADVKKSADEVAAEQEFINDQKKYISKMIDTATQLVNPTKWVGVTVNAVAYVGQEVVDKTLSSDRLEQLQAKLSAAKGRLREIKRREHALRLATATKALDMARLDLAHAKKEFLARAATVRLKETTVVETLERSRATRGAAGAVEERGTVVKAALDAEQHLQTYLERAAKSLRLAEDMDAAYLRVINSAGVAGSARDEAHVLHLVNYSALNREALAEVQFWLRTTLKEAHESLAFVGQSSYFAGYAEIPAALGAALVGRNAPRTKGGKQ